ncbi:hypothetical protein FRC10_009507 [Ceratobasidium sp. 414]|nr:hypothetical protein FRC10_009507 [Ceratobasidium sp. 414]
MNITVHLSSRFYFLSVPPEWSAELLGARLKTSAGPRHPHGQVSTTRSAADSLHLVLQPGLVTTPTMMKLPARTSKPTGAIRFGAQASCDIDTPRNVTCEQGLVPTYSVAATGADDISKAVKFASKNNVKLVVKNTGHD